MNVRSWEYHTYSFTAANLLQCVISTLSVGQDAQVPQLEETTEQDGPHKCVQVGKQWLEVCAVLNVYE